MGFENTQIPPSAGAPIQRQAGFTTTATDTTLSEAIITLRKRRWVLIIAVLLGHGVWHLPGGVAAEAV